MKKDFKMNQMIKIDQTTSSELDGKIGKIIGIAVEDVTNYYIVQVEFEMPSRPPGASALMLTEACMFAIEGIKS